MGVPRLSVGLPVYNGEAFIREALDSLLHQDYRDFELIISDNASTDGTREICEEYAARYTRVRYFRNSQNIGAARNYVRVFELSRGELFKWAAHDDVHLPGFFRRCIDSLDSSPPTVLLSAPRAEVIDENGRRTPDVVERLATQRSLPHQRVADVLGTVRWATAQFGVFRAQALRATGLIRPYFASDYVLLTEVALRGGIVEVPEVLFLRRNHPGMSTHANASPMAMLQWFDPAACSRSLLPPYTRVGVECLRAVSRARLTRWDRTRCYVTVLRTWSGREAVRLWNKARNTIALRTRFRLLWARAHRSQA